MRSKPTAPPRKSPKPIAEGLDARLPYDKRRTDKSARQASDAADRLMREMDAVLKQLDRKT